MTPLLKSRFALLAAVTGIVVMLWGCIISLAVMLLRESAGASVDILGVRLRFSAMVLGMSLGAFVLCCAAAALLEWLAERDPLG